MSNLARKTLVHFIQPPSGDWYKIGLDIDDMSMELNPDVESKQNILGETSVVHNGFSPSMDADPYYANPDDSVYDDLAHIAMNRDYSDAASRWQLLEVIISDETATSHAAWQEDAVIIPQSYGGDTSGFQIPFQVQPAGNRRQGTVTITGGVPVFTES